MKNETVICSYRVKRGKEKQFKKLVSRHWSVLKKEGLVVGKPSEIYQGLDKNNPLFIEIFTWKNSRAVDNAHTNPNVMQIWEGMGALTEARNGHRGMEFPHVKKVKVGK